MTPLRNSRTPSRINRTAPETVNTLKTYNKFCAAFDDPMEFIRNREKRLKKAAANDRLRYQKKKESKENTTH